MRFFKFGLTAVLMGLTAASGFTQTENRDAWVGIWDTKLSVDQKAAYVDVVNPFHKKLLDYAIDQVGKATVTIALRPTHTALYVFNDRYPPDDIELSGTWQMQGDNIRIDFHFPGADGKSADAVHTLTVSNSVATWDYVPGLPKFFHGNLVPSKFKTMQEMPGTGKVPFAAPIAE